MKRFLLIAGLASFASFANANLLSNGSFETGITPGSFTTLFSGDTTSVSGWSVTAGSVDYIGSYWNAQDGVRSIDLGGNSAGSISTSFATVSGKKYLLSFWMAGNPDYPGQPNDPSTFQLGVTAGNLSNATFSFGPKGTNANMGWEQRSTIFTATSNSTLLTFASILPPGAWGPALDNVVVTEAVPEPFTMAFMGIAALAGYGKVRRRKTA